MRRLVVALAVGLLWSTPAVAQVGGGGVAFILNTTSDPVPVTLALTPTVTVGNTVTVTATDLDVQIGGSDALTIGTFPDNEPINVAQFGGSAVATGTGASGVGVPRVTVALDAVTYNSPTAVSVDGASEQVLASNASRKGAILTNTSSDTISCAVAATAVANQGIVLPPYSVWTMLRESLGTGAVNCISSGAASNLAVQELQ